MVGALIRGAFLSAASYRLRILPSFVGLVVTLIPLFFVADALQPAVAASIRQEGEQYFGFLLLGIATLGFVAFGLGCVERPISSGISKIALKGGALRQCVYDSTLGRPMRDIDLLVEPDQAGAAGDVAMGLGESGRREIRERWAGSRGGRFGDQRSRSMQ